jgi:hypothetical protein
MTNVAFVIRRNGNVVVLRGWKAWLAALTTMLVAWLVLAVVAFLVVGLTVTMGVLLLLLVPAVLLVAGLHALFGRRIPCCTMGALASAS